VLRLTLDLYHHHLKISADFSVSLVYIDLCWLGITTKISEKHAEFQNSEIEDAIRHIIVRKVNLLRNAFTKSFIFKKKRYHTSGTSHLICRNMIC
jgi:hypothetical protein